MTIYLHSPEGDKEADVNNGDTLTVAKDCYDEKGLQIFDLDKQVKAGTVITVENIIHNHYGTMVLTTINGKRVFLNPRNLTDEAV